MKFKRHLAALLQAYESFLLENEQLLNTSLKTPEGWG